MLPWDVFAARSKLADGGQAALEGHRQWTRPVRLNAPVREGTAQWNLRLSRRKLSRQVAAAARCPVAVAQTESARWGVRNPRRGLARQQPRSTHPAILIRL